ncbi:MAG: fibronectin type III domain-containing protein, partial [Muribaculaceae bacterium]|nr:fibronectin type III domain-containing protein [Muribaculaceae bacterium]
MKQKLLHFWFVIAAIITAIPIANAAASDYNVAAQTPGEVWKKTFTTPGGDAYQAAILPNGYLYVIGTATNFETYTYKTLYRINQNGVATGSSGYTNVNYGMAADDKGCIAIITQAWNTSNNLAKDLSLRTPNASTGHLEYVSGSSNIDLSAATIPAYTYYFDATGDLQNGTGYLWFPPVANNNKIKVVKTVRNADGTWSSSAQSYTLPFSPGASNPYLQVYESDAANNIWKFLFLNPFGDIYDCTLNNGTITATVISLPVARKAAGLSNAQIFFLGGHKMLAYNTGNNNGSGNNKANQFVIYDMTTKTTIATVQPFTATVSGSKTSIGSWINSQKVSESQTDLFIYCPAVGASRLSLKATPITSAVTSPKAALASGSTSVVNVTWGKPSQGTATKYAISYSSDGGSTWSTAVETTNLSYTFNNLETGTYKFKVTPYFGGSSTWGPESIAPESIEVITAVGAPISNLAYTYLKNTETNIGRQDITLTWNAPTGMVNTTVTGYKVYRNGSLLTTLGAEETEYTNTGVKQNYTYKVVPMFDGLIEDASFGLEVTTTEVQAGVLVAPVISETRNYEGYSLVEIFFKMPNYAPYKPLYFNLYRDGKLIQGKLQSYNTLDESLVRASVETTVKYQVEAVYGSAADVYPPIDSVKSDITTLVIAPRDWAKTGYILQEVYNVPINEIADDKKPALFDNNNYYRQGQFNTVDKKWYIAQRSDNLSKTDAGTSGGGQISSGVEGSTGGVVVYSAENADQVMNGFEKIITKPEFENVGIAMDDAGTLFVRNNNKTKLSATNQAGFTIPTGDWFADAFERRITEGTFYKYDATTGKYTEQATKLDLTALWTQNAWIEDMYFTGVGSDLANAGTNSNFGQVKGRCDYYHMWGDVLSAEGGYLILSPSWTRTAFKVKIANGAYVSHEIVEFNRYENTGYLLEPKTGTENYGFKLDGRDAVTVQIRSNGYYGVHEWNKAGTTGWHPIYTADSRINNAGGTSIQAFGEVDGTGRHTGELFVITPQSMHSHNVGDFLISRATKENADDYADEGSLMPSTPVAQYIQTDARSNSTATNANGNWFHAEKGTYASAMKDDDECVDIYQYVPGTRFARYRLIPSNQFPPVQPTLDITTAYNDDKTDITHFDGVATWQRPAGFGRSTGSANAKVVSYLFEMYNNKNELVTSAELPELYKTDGTPVDDEYVYDFNYTDTTGNKDIDFGRYSVNVRVKYQTKDGLYHISDPLYAEDIHDYPAEAVQNLATFAFKQANQTVDEWVEKDGQWVVEQKQVDNYRVEINFDKPDCDEPVS